LYSFEKIGWNINLPNGLEPWRGYAVYAIPQNTSQPMYLLVMPKAINPQSNKSVASATAPGEWTMQITATAGSATDQINWMGVRHNASPEYDANDLFEPPVIGKYVSLYFPHKEWTTLPQNYTADYRPLANDGYAWDFEVATAKGHGTVTLKFDGMAEIPAGLEVYLIDEQLGAARNLRQNSSYSFRANADGGKKALRVVVGSRSYVETNSNEVSLVPANFELAQNYPNPFNPETTIPFSVGGGPTCTDHGRQYRVSLRIYNLLTQLVAVPVLQGGSGGVAGGQPLENVLLTCGQYTAYWDGKYRNTGRDVASGIYLYRLEVNGRPLFRKMIVTK
jgi:hypothetical protein